MIIQYIGLSGLFGVSMICALISDIISFTTLHLYLFYLISAKLYSWEINVIISLFRLFRGMWVIT
jgi:phosphatidylinositol glycan class Q protein